MLFRKFYCGPLVDPHSSTGTLPEVQHIIKTIFADIGFAPACGREPLILVSCSTISQRRGRPGRTELNLTLGLEERTGLV